MVIVGFNFKIINAEKKGAYTGKININNNVSVKALEESPLSVSSQKQSTINFVFEYTSSYEPNVAFLQLTGELSWLDNSERINEIMDEWKKTKKLPKDIMPAVLNNILARCNIEAIILSKELNLPPPIPLPKVEEQRPKPVVNQEPKKKAK
jgi:hypothetical protein